MTESNSGNPPSSFIARWVPLVAAELGRRRRALDVASGRGRHALLMAAAGFRVTAVDIQLAGLESTAASARGRGLCVDAVCADLTAFPLPADRFHLIVVTRYLDRGLFPALRQALLPGGVLLYETFTEHQLRYARGPRSRDHLLKPGELRMLVGGMDVLFDEEVWEPDAVARIAARRRRVSEEREP